MVQLTNLLARGGEVAADDAQVQEILGKYSKLTAEQEDTIAATIKQVRDSGPREQFVEQPGLDDGQRAAIKTTRH